MLWCDCGYFEKPPLYRLPWLTAIMSDPFPHTRKKAIINNTS